MEPITLDTALALVRAVIYGSTSPDAKFAAVAARTARNVEANPVVRAAQREDTVPCLVHFGADSGQLHEGLARLAALWT